MVHFGHCRCLFCLNIVVVGPAREKNSEKNKFIGFGTTEARLRLHEIKEKRNSPGAALEYGYWAGTGTERTVY